VIANDQGFETELNWQANEKLNLKASYAFITGETTQKIGSKDTTFNNLIRRPKHTINLYAGYQASKNFFVSAGFQSFSKRDDVFYNPANFYTPEPKVLDPYSLLNAYAEYGFRNNRLKVFLDVKNVFDTHNYYEVYGFNVQGINLTASIEFYV
jgi:vitamin B12 transporter